jgi:acetyl esterase/lipase
MPSEHLEQVINAIKSAPGRDGATIEERRAAMEAVTVMFPVSEDVTCQPVDAAGVPAEWISAPGVDPHRVIFYLHGGGYAIGSINTHREMVSRLSGAAAARALSVGYRLAPEHPFPAAVEDATAAYRWLLSTGAEPSRIIIAGDSAGGGLTVATLVALRDAGDPLPAAAVCLSPWVDMEGLGDSMTSKADLDPMIQRETLLEGAKAYLGGADPRTPLAAPIHADLAGLPPMLIQVGTAETLLDDSVRLAARAKSAGVDVTLEPWDDMIHVWQFFAALLPEGRQAVDRIGEFVRQHTGTARTATQV